MGNEVSYQKSMAHVGAYDWIIKIEFKISIKLARLHSEPRSRFSGTNHHVGNHFWRRWPPKMQIEVITLLVSTYSS